MRHGPTGGWVKWNVSHLGGIHICRKAHGKNRTRRLLSSIPSGCSGPLASMLASDTPRCGPGPSTAHKDSSLLHSSPAKVAAQAEQEVPLCGTRSHFLASATAHLPRVGSWNPVGGLASDTCLSVPLANMEAGGPEHPEGMLSQCTENTNPSSKAGQQLRGELTLKFRASGWREFSWLSHKENKMPS